MTPRRSWIQDYCEDSNWPADEKHAQGLLKLHAACTPSCPRKLSAERWLRARGIVDRPDGNDQPGVELDDQVLPRHLPPEGQN